MRHGISCSANRPSSRSSRTLSALTTAPPSAYRQHHFFRKRAVPAHSSNNYIKEIIYEVHDRCSVAPGSCRHRMPATGPFSKAKASRRRRYRDVNTGNVSEMNAIIGQRFVLHMNLQPDAEGVDGMKKVISPTEVSKGVFCLSAEHFSGHHR